MSEVKSKENVMIENQQKNEQINPEETVDTGSEDGDMFEYMGRMLQQQQMVNVGMMANLLTHGDKNVCGALVDIKGAIDTNSRCLLKLHDTLERYLNK